MDRTTDAAPATTPTKAGFSAFTPLTPGMDSTGIDSVRFSIEIVSTTGGVQLRPAVQYSDDGIDWTGTVTSFDITTSAGSWASSVGWTPSQGTTSGNWHTLTGDGLFVRFGILAENTLGNGRPEGAIARLRVQTRPIAHTTLAGGPKVVGSRGSTTNDAFIPLTRMVETSRISEIRATTFLDQPSDDLTLQAAYQTSNDGYSWNTAATVPGSTVLTAQGYDYGAFSSFSASVLDDDRYMRFGVIALNSSGTTRQFGTASVRIDIRGET